MRDYPHTLACLDLDTTVRGVAVALLAHVITGERTYAGRPVPLPVFLETFGGAPAMDDALSGVILEEFVRSVAINMNIEPLVLIFAVVLVERLVMAVGTAQIRRHTVRPVFATAAIIAAKTWYEETIFVGDFAARVCGDNAATEGLLHCEAVFCAALRFTLSVRAQTLAKYHFAICDVLQAAQGCAGAVDAAGALQQERCTSCPPALRRPSPEALPGGGQGADARSKAARHPSVNLAAPSPAMKAAAPACTPPRVLTMAGKHLRAGSQDTDCGWSTSSVSTVDTWGEVPCRSPRQRRRSNGR